MRGASSRTTTSAPGLAGVARMAWEASPPSNYLRSALWFAPIVAVSTLHVRVLCAGIYGGRRSGPGCARRSSSGARGGPLPYVSRSMRMCMRSV